MTTNQQGELLRLCGCHIPPEERWLPVPSGSAWCQFMRLFTRGYGSAALPGRDAFGDRRDIPRTTLEREVFLAYALGHELRFPIEHLRKRSATESWRQVGSPV